MKTTVCTLENVIKKYGSNTILGPISLSVYSGEVLGIRGLNGAGKSTLIKLMAGVLRPDGGEITAFCTEIGYAPQDIALYPSLSGRDNLRFWADVAGLKRRAVKSRIRWLLEQTDLSAYGSAKVETYSGGMKRRLNLAAAMVTTPKIMLLDEPMAGVDTHSEQTILEMVSRLRDRGCAVVIVSHSDEELERICDRILTLKSGCKTEMRTVRGENKQ